MSSAALQELAASIRVHGMLQPILVRSHPSRSDRYEIIGGERRWRAAQLIPLHEVPVVIREFDDQQAMAAALVENLQREDLRALEEAEGYQRLIKEFGLTQEALGEAVGKSRSHVANTLRLLGLPEPVRVLLRDGALSAGHARALLSAPDPTHLARQIIERGLNVRQTEELASAKPRIHEPGAASARHNPEAQALEQELSMLLGLTVTVRQNGAGGQMMIRYRTLDQLDQLISLLRRP
jgi:ParB family chromosome partitioning protein